MPRAPAQSTRSYGHPELSEDDEAMSTATHARLVRDRATWQAYLQYGLFGYFFYAFAVTVALLRDEQGYTRSVASLHGTSAAIAAVVVGLGAAALVRRIGRGSTLRLASLLIIAGLMVYAAGGPLAFTLAGAFVASCGGWLVMVGLNAFIPDHHASASPRAMSEGQGAGAAFGLLAPLAVGAAVALGWGWRPALLAVCAALIGLEVWRARGLRVFDGRSGRRSVVGVAVRRQRLPRLYWMALVVFGLAASLEFCLALWGGDLLRERGGLGEAAAVASLATVVGGMTVGRLGGSVIVGRFEADNVLLATLAVTMVGLAVTWSSANPWGMLVGLTITGLGLGLQSPLAVGRAVLAAGAQVDRASSYTAVAVGVANGIAPFVLAAIADVVGVHLAFLTVPALVVAAFVLVAAGRIPAGGLPEVRTRAVDA